MASDHRTQGWLHNLGEGAEEVSRGKEVWPVLREQWLTRLWNGKAEEMTCAKVTKEINWKKKLKGVSYVWSSRHLRERSKKISWKGRQDLIMEAFILNVQGNSLKDLNLKNNMITFHFRLIPLPQVWRINSSVCWTQRFLPTFHILLLYFWQSLLHWNAGWPAFVPPELDSPIPWSVLCITWPH